MSSLWNANKNIGVAYAKFNKNIVLPIVTGLIGIVGIALIIFGATKKDKTPCMADADCDGVDNKCNNNSCTKTKPIWALIITGIVLLVSAPLIFVGGRWWANTEIRNPGLAAAALDFNIASNI